MDHNYSEEWNSIILLPLTETAGEQYRQLRNMEDIRKWFVSTSEISEKQQKEWFHNYLKDEKDIMFSIHLNDDERTFVGANAIYHISRSKKEGEYGRIAIMPQYAGKGIGYAATMAACTIAKRSVGLERLILEVYQNNTAAIKVYKKAGFEYRKDHQYGNSHEGMIHMVKKL